MQTQAMRDSLKYRLAIHSARNREEVIEAVRGYFSGLTEHEVASLPPPLRGVLVWGADEVVNAGILLTEATEAASNHAPESGLLKDITAVVTLAGLRLSILSMRPPDVAA